MQRSPTLRCDLASGIHLSVERTTLLLQTDALGLIDHVEPIAFRDTKGGEHRGGRMIACALPILTTSTATGGLIETGLFMRPP